MFIAQLLGLLHSLIYLALYYFWEYRIQYLEIINELKTITKDRLPYPRIIWNWANYIWKWSRAKFSVHHFKSPLLLQIVAGLARGSAQNFAICECEDGKVQ